MTDRRLTDDQLAAALRAHLPASARPEMRAAIMARTENVAQQRAMPSILGRLTDADPIARRRAFLIAAAALLAVAVAGAAVAGALRLWQRSIVDVGATGLVAFVRQGDLYLAEPDGSGEALVAHVDGSPLSDPTWSPDGRWIVVQTTEPAVLVFDVRAPALRRLAAGYIGAWSPDGVSLAVASRFGEINIIESESGAARTLVNLWQAPLGGAEPMAWSPDGRWLMASGPVRIDPVSGAMADAPSVEANCATRFAWSPDSNRLVLSCWRERGMPDRFWIAAADGSSSVEIVDPDGIPIDPGWSPDGSWISYVSLNRAARPDDLIIVRPDGSGRRTLATDVGGIVGWSSDGAVITYTTCGQCGWKEAPVEEVAGLHQVALADGSDRSLPVPGDASAFDLGPVVGMDLDGIPTISLPSPIPSPPETPAATPGDAPRVQPDASWGRLLFGVDRWDAAGNHDACIVEALHFPDDLRQVRVEAGQAPHVTLVPVGPGASQPPQPTFDAGCRVAVRWAPDGSGYTVSPGASSFQVFAADGSPRSGRIPLHGEGPVWSPDGAWVSGQDCPSSERCDGGYHLVRPDGTGVRDLPGRPSWSADGAVLAAAAPDGSLWVGPPDGTDLRDIGKFPMPGGWSPDGSAFVFVRDGEAWIAGADGSHVRNLTTAELVGLTRAWWSTDGKLIATLEGSALWLRSPDGNFRKRIGIGFGEDGWSQDWAPVWSPDGSWMAIGSTDDVTLVRMGDWHPVLVANAHSPVWSPDGRYLAVMTTDTAGSYAGAVMNADGSGRRIVTGRVDTLSLIWAP